MFCAVQASALRRLKPLADRVLIRRIVPDMKVRFPETGLMNINPRGALLRFDVSIRKLPRWKSAHERNATVVGCAFVSAQTAGGVLLPDQGVKKNEGEVVAVGPGATAKDGQKIPMSVAEGDKVLLPEYGGHTIKMGEDEFQLFRDEDILAKFEE